MVDRGDFETAPADDGARVPMKIGEILVRDDSENVCFGCSPHNPRGLQLRFTRTGDNTVMCRFTAASHLAGAPGVVHGGIQATVLDEVLGVAAHTRFGSEEEPSLVTADFELHYRRPVPLGEPLVVRGELVRAAGRDLHVVGQIETEAGEALTLAEARWRRIDGPSESDP
jgi:uncharacterized protein (TIGR00369 family)